MNKKLITIIIALAAVAAWAQEKQSKIGYVAMSNIDNYITIDTATVRVWYALNALDIKDENTYIDWQILEVGGHCNKYYSYFLWESDSLRTVDRRTNRSGNFSKKLLPRGRNGYGNWNELQYHVLIAEDGKIRTYNRERLPQYEGYYDEPYPGQQAMDADTGHGHRQRLLLPESHVPLPRTRLRGVVHGGGSREVRAVEVRRPARPHR